MSNDAMTSAQQILADARRAALGADTSPQPAFNAARGGVDVGDKPVAQRSTFGAINDTMIDTANAAAGLVKSGIDLFGPGSEAAKFIDEKIIKDGQSKQSDQKKSYRDTLALDLKEAGVNDGTTSSQLDAEGRKAWIQLKHAFTTDPLGTVGEIGGNLGPFAIIGGGMQAARLAGWVKTGIASVLSSGLSVGEVRGNIWEKVSGMPDAELQASSPAYAELRSKGMPELAARQEVGANFMRNLPELAAVGAIGALGGKYGVEGMAAGVFPKMGRLGASAVGGFNEGFVQGGSEQLATNIGVQRVKPNQSLLEDLGPNIVAEGLPGVAMGMASGGRGNAQVAPAPEVVPPVANPLIDQLAAANGPLSRAAVAANPDLKQAPPVEPPTNPLDQRAVDLSNLLRDGPLLAHLQSTGQTAVASDLLGALAFAKNPQLSNQARQQAVNYLTEQIGQMQAAIMPADQAQDTTLAGADMADAAIDNTADVAQQPALVQPSPPTPEVVTPFTAPNPELVQIETQNATENIAEQTANTPATAEYITEKSAARTTVQAPKVATPPGTGTAQARQRKAQLQAMVDGGLNEVERRADGFWLVNHASNEEMRLDNAGDAQMARVAAKNARDAAAHASINSPLNDKNPASAAQIKADNYPKPPINRFGLVFKSENPAGSTRSGVDASGEPWSITMANHYTGIEGTTSSDGGLVDAFLGDGNRIFVIDQVDPSTGKHDEPKVMAGFRNEDEARAAYLANYAPGWQGLGAITEMTVPQFATWVKSSAARQPAAGYDASSNQGDAHDGRGIDTASADVDQRGGTGVTGNTTTGDGLRHSADSSARDGRESAGGATEDARQAVIDKQGVAHLTASNNAHLKASRISIAAHKATLVAELQAATNPERITHLKKEIARSPVLVDPPASELQAFSSIAYNWVKTFGGNPPVGYWDQSENASDGFEQFGNTYVNLANPTMALQWTVAHEADHSQEKIASPEEEDLRNELWDQVTIKGRTIFFEGFLFRGQKYAEASEDQLITLKKEMLAEFKGARFTDEVWLTDLARQKPNLFGRFVAEWVPTLGRMIDSLKSRYGIGEDSPKNVDRFMKNLVEAKAIAMKMAIIWAERHPKLAEQTGVDEILYSRTDPYAEYEFGQDEESFDDFDMDSMDLQAEMEAEQAQTQDRLSPPQLDVTDAEIKVAGLMAEEAFPDLAWRADPDARGMQQEAEIVGLYQPGITYQVAMNLDRSGLWSVDLRGTWVGPAMNESDGYATEAAVKLFTKRQIAAIDLKEREFDLASTSGKALQKRLVEGWKSIQHASARKFGRLGRTARSLKEIADDMGLLKQYEVTIHREILDAHSSVQNVTFKHKEKSISGSALLAQHEAGGKKFLSANTAEMGKSGLGAAFYQMAAEYAARHNMTLRPDAFLSGINSYRRTEQMLSAALRTGKSNVMVPHPVQRVYGFEDDASRAEQHQANLARLILAGVRNARELVPGFDELRYNPSTKTFTDTTGQPKDDEVEQMLKDVDARAFGMGRGTLARSVLSHMVMLDEIKLNSELVFAEPVLYSERVRDEVQGDPSQTNIVYEVAPDPNDAIVSQAWNQLTTEQRLAASEAVTHVITPKVLAALGASGKQVTQIGSYLDDTNTSFALTLDQGDALSVSHALGYVLSQDSMVVLSEQPFRGGDATGSVHIRVGDKSAAEIDAIYQQLRAIQADGEQPIGGQSTANGVMVVLNFSNINNDELGQLIDAKLAGAYDVSGHDIYAAFPQKEDYNYDLQKSNPRGNQSLLWQALNPLRREAAGLIGRYIDKHSGRDAGDGGGRLAGGRASDSQGAAQQSEIARRGTGQGKSHPAELTPLPGAPNVPGFHGPDPQLVQVARQYARDNGITLHRQAEYVEINKDRATRIAKAYADMPHAPQDPVVKEAFDNLIKQTTAQYQSLVDAGYKFWFFDLDKPDNLKYISTPWNAMRDIRANKEMGVFSTEDGFGNGDAIRDNPLETTVMDFTWPSGGLNGPQKKVLANDLFRAVHDAFGHGLEGAGFRDQGEENAWQAHIRLFTGSAIGAITSETRGQNSWVNFGPHADSNHTAKAEDTVFADQKTGLMPAWTWTEGVAGDVINHSARVGDTHFTTEALSRAHNQEGGRVVSLTPQQFLSLAAAGASPIKQAKIDDLLARGEPLTHIPELFLTYRADGSARVIRHDGRHRVRALLAQGVERIPVLVEGRYAGRVDGKIPLSQADLSRVVAQEGGAVVDLSHSIRAPLFYSELTRQIEQTSMKQAPAGAWKSHIKALSQKGVKADEIEWSGVNEWLDLQVGKVSRQALTDYLDANGVQVQETVLGQPDEGEIEALLNDEVGEGMSREDAIEHLSNDEGATPTKYSQYQLPGGTNYREVLLTLPKAEERVPLPQLQKRRQVLVELKEDYLANNFTVNAELMDARIAAVQNKINEHQTPLRRTTDYKSSHWDAPNVLAHIRVNDRTDATGAKVLFIEELQSDWNTDGRKKGFKEEIEKKFSNLLDMRSAAKGEERDAIQKQIDEMGRGDIGVPTAPFVTATDKWLSLALKRIVKMAVDGGYDKVAFVNGEQSADRYDLSKQIHSIEYKVSGDQNYKLVVTDKNGNLLSIPPTLSPDGLEQYVGKEMAQKIVDTAKPQAQWIEGVDLSVGGEGMKAFYDKIVPNTAKEVIRKLGGGQMEAVSLQVDRKMAASTERTAYMESMHAKYGDMPASKMNADELAKLAVIESGERSQPGFTLTDAMRAKAAAGLPLFSKRSLDDLEAEQDHQDAAPKAPKTRPYAGKKVDIPVKIEDTGEVATLIMDVNQTLDDYAEQMENMKQLLECLA